MMVDDANKIFSGDDLERAVKWLEVTASRPTLNAIHFRNALHAFVRGVDSAQGAISPLKIMAVDATEVVALTDYNPISHRTFAFEGLLHNKRQDNRRIELLDRLINQHLLVSRTEPFLLMPSHADEVIIMQQVISSRARRQEQALDQTSFRKISSDQRNNIKKWFKSLEEHSLKKNWREFKNTFLDDISDKLLANIINDGKINRSFDSFIKNAQYVLLSGPSNGKRSLAAHIEEVSHGSFDWDAYNDYCSKRDVQDRARQIIDALTNLLFQLRSGKRPDEVVGETVKREMVKRDAVVRDAQAIALIDLLNRFFVNQKTGVRIDLVSRAPSLHSLMSSLPEGVLHVTLRHPLFLPDIYAFDLNQLNRLGEVLLRVDATLASAIDIEALPNPSEGSPQLKLIKEVRRCAFDVVDVLDSALIVRQALESTSFDKATGDPKISELIRDFFQRVEAGNDDGQDLFSSHLPAQLAKRNEALAEFARQRVFNGLNETIQFRLIDFFPKDEDTVGRATGARPIEGLMPDVLMMVRADQGEFRRVFFVHSGRAADMIRKSRRPDATGKSVSLRLAQLSVDSIFSQLSSALTGLTTQKDKHDKHDDSTVFNLDATLVVCITFASRGRYDTAIALASTVLHKITSELRNRDTETLTIERMRERLAYRELFLFRHYCERALARYDFFSQERRLAGSQGSVAKNLARAQRDLDFATLMAEQIEWCTGEGTPSPAGNEVVQDWRLRLAHLGCWIDQLVMIRHAETTWVGKENRTDRRRLSPNQERLDVFTAAGLIKETALIAWTVRKKRESLTPGGAHAENLERYYAYIEATSLQSALLIFCIFMAYPLSPPLHRLWLGDTSIEPERILVFRDWENWYKQYGALDDDFGFTMRPRKLIETICTTLQKAARLPVGLRGSPGRSGGKEPGPLAELLSNCVEDLKNFVKSKPSSYPTGNLSWASDTHGFLGILSSALVDRIKPIIEHDLVSGHRVFGENQGAVDDRHIH